MSVESGLSPQAPYRIDHEGTEFVIRVRRDLFSREELTDFLDWLYLESVRRKESLGDEQIAELADEVDHAVWERLRPMVEENLRGR